MGLGPCLAETDEEIKHEEEAYPELEYHVAVVLENVAMVECIERNPYNQDDGENQHEYIGDSLEVSAYKIEPALHIRFLSRAFRAVILCG